MSNFKTAILGAGPIGGILGSFLVKQQEDVILVDNNREHIDAIKSYGILISGVEEMNVTFDKYCYSIDELKDFDHDLIVICLKTPVMEKVIPNLKKVVKKNEKILCFQNGLYNELFIAEHFGTENVIRVVANFAGNYLSPGKIKMTFFNKPNYIGAPSPANEELAKTFAQILSNGGLDTSWCEDIRREEWVKTILNAALSPISAITGLTMKDIMDTAGTRELVEKSLMEGIRVAHAVGYDMPPHFFEYGIEYLSKAGHHKPSMRIDIENEDETEISFLNEKIVKFGHIYGVPTPVNIALTYLVKGMEQEIRGRKKE